MASLGTAPALKLTRIIVGPLVTQGGFQYWYLACFPDHMVAVRQGMSAFFALGLSNSMGRVFGLVGALVHHFLQPRSQAVRERIEATLQSTSSVRLSVKDNVVFQAVQLKVITYKLKKGAPAILSDLVLETKTGSKQRYGINPTDFDKIRLQLKQMYPVQASSI